MKIVKGIAVYTLIILGAIVLLGLILLGLMFIFPKFSLFGYNFQYKSYDETTFDAVDLANVAIIDQNGNIQVVDVVDPVVNLYINPGDYNLKLNLTTEGTSIYSSVMNNYAGFVKTEGGAFKVNTTVSSSLERRNGHYEIIYNLTLNQPEGAVALRDGNEFRVTLPKNIIKPITYNLTIVGGNGDIEIDGAYENNVYKGKMKVQNLSISTKRGDIKLKGLADEVIEGAGVESKTVSLTNLNLYTEGGVVDFTNYNSIVLTEKVILNSTRADYKFKNLYAQKGIEINGTNVRFEADNVSLQGVSDQKEFVYKATTGTLKIGRLNASSMALADAGSNYNTTGFKAYESTIITESASIDIGELIGSFGIEKEYGDVNITHCTNAGSIRNVHGNINITTSGYFKDANKKLSDASSLILTNDMGNITVGEYYQKGVFTTTSGDVKVNNKGDYNPTFFTQITTKNGSIDVQSKINRVYATSTGKGNIKAFITNISQTSSEDAITFEGRTKVDYGFKVASGDLTIVLPSTGNAYNVYAKGTISGKITNAYPLINDQSVVILPPEGYTPEANDFANVCLLGGDIIVHGSN